MSATDIRNLREKLRLTARQLADILGVTENTVNRWETGLRVAKGAAANVMRQMDRDNRLPDWCSTADGRVLAIPESVASA